MKKQKSQEFKVAKQWYLSYTADQFSFTLAMKIQRLTETNLAVNVAFIGGGLVHRMMTRIDLPHGIRKRLKHISGHTQHMEGVLADICDIVHPMHPQYGKVEMGQFLEDWCKAAQPEAKITGTSFTFDIEGGMPEIYIDQSLIRQALWYIVENSFNARTERDGEIFIKAEGR